MKPARQPAIFKCRHSDPELMAAVSVRMLLAHQADGFAERGVALSLSYDPTPSTPGGLLIVDNMLWGGRIFDAADRSAATEGVRALTRALASRPSWISSLMPIRDGLIVALWQPGS